MLFGDSEGFSAVLQHIKNQRRRIENQIAWNPKIRPVQAVIQDKAADKHRADVVADTKKPLSFLPGHFSGCNQISGNFAAHGKSKQQAGGQRIDSGAADRKDVFQQAVDFPGKSVQDSGMDQDVGENGKRQQRRQHFFIPQIQAQSGGIDRFFRKY